MTRHCLEKEMVYTGLGSGIQILQSSQMHRLGVIAMFAIPTLSFATHTIWSKLHKLSNVSCPNPLVKGNNCIFLLVVLRRFKEITHALHLIQWLAQIISRQRRGDADQMKEIRPGEVLNHFRLSSFRNYSLLSLWNHLFCSYRMSREHFSLVQYLSMQTRSRVGI